MQHPTEPEAFRHRPASGGVVGAVIGCTMALAVLVVAGAVIFFLVVKRAVETTPLPAGQMVFTGDWQGQDGTTLSIRADGSGTYKSGNTSIDGGQVRIDETAKSLTISMGPFKKTYSLDEWPRELEGATYMTLGGMAFRRTAGFTPPANAPAEAPPGK